MPLPPQRVRVTTGERDEDAGDYRPTRKRRLRVRRRRRDARLTRDQLRAAYLLYRRQGVSLNALAAKLWERFGYSSQASCYMALYTAFRRDGYHLRSHPEATSLAVTKHGRCAKGANRRDYHRWLRDRNRRPRCQGVKTRGGTPCQLPALEGSDYCGAHDPVRGEEWRTRLAEARRKRAA